MARHCMRPGCDRPAAARLTYDTGAAAVWLDRPVEDGQPAQQVCGVHAATLTAPLGWSVTDRRLVESEPDFGTNGALPTRSSPTRSSMTRSSMTGGSVSPFAESGAIESGPTEPGPTEPVPTEPVPPEPMPPEPMPPDPRPAVAGEQESVLSEPQEPDDPGESHDPGDQRIAVAASGSSDSTGSDSKPRGKLLDRAFEWTGPQHSVLTTRHDNRPRPKT